MGINLGDVFPNFDAETTIGRINFHEWLGKSWAILFSHPADYTPVCTTELARVHELTPEFEQRGVKLIALSCDPVSSHNEWIKDVNAFIKQPLHCELAFPIIGDEKRELAVKLGMIGPAEKDAGGLPLTCRAVFIIGPDQKLKLSVLYPASTGRNFNEILRAVDSVQLTMNKKVATPVDWKDGDTVMVLPTIKEDEAAAMFPKGVDTMTMPSGKPYMRFTPQP